MNELTPLPQLVAEINDLFAETRENIIKMGRLQIGPSATLKEISRIVGPQLGLKPDECLEILIHSRNGGKV